MKKIIVGITGASGSIYFLRLMEKLIREDICIYVVASEQGEKVLKYETGIELKAQIEAWKKINKEIYLEDNNNLFSPIASGSFGADKMIIIPCSMSTLAEIAHGITKTLLTRSADVMIKERKNLVLVPRETPLSSIHLENMLKLSNIGVTILQATPGFYNFPKTIDDLVNFVVGKALDSLKIKNDTYIRWEGKKENE
jgi:4-hydroxy-3-polyprenylbenzoate decarboxylase